MRRDARNLVPENGTDWCAFQPVPTALSLWNARSTRRLISWKVDYLVPRALFAQFCYRQLERVREALAKYQLLDAQSSPLAQAQADLEFHDTILVAAGSHILTTITRQVLAVTITHRSRYAYTPEQLKQAQTQHESIFNAISTGDYALAKWLMAEHVNKSSDLAAQHLSSFA